MNNERERDLFQFFQITWISFALIRLAKSDKQTIQVMAMSNHKSILLSISNNFYFAHFYPRWDRKLFSFGFIYLSIDIFI